MNKFDELAQDLGWKRLYENIGVFISKEEDRNGYLSINFPAAEGYENFDLNDNRIDKDFVSKFIFGICCSNKFKEKSKKWAVPLMVSDYFAHKRDYKNELIWAKKAMEENKNLKPENFSFNIRKNL